MRHKLTTLFVAIIIFIATTFPVAAHIQHAISCVASNNFVHTPKHICSFDTIPNYVIPYNVPLVDKAPVTAVDAKLSQLLVPVKHYCLHTHDLAAVDRALKPYMLYAKEHNRIEHFYTEVSLLTTFLVNSSANYAAAIDYQTKMLDYAKKHNHLYGIMTGLVSLGNMHRSCFQLVQAIDAYKQALELNKKYPSRFHDIGIDYKRIAECYFIAINFEKTLEMANLGLALSKSEVSIGGLQCIKALALFMLDRDAEFIKAYNAYKSYTNVALGVSPHMANCVEVMKKIYDADYAAVDKMLTHENIGGYITYIDVAYNKRLKNYPRVLDAMRRYNILAYGESNGAFAPGFMQMGSVVTNNLAELDRRRAANENSRLELTRINLELTKTQLELYLSRDSQLIANTAAESQRLTYNNQRLLARQLSDSLATQRLLRKASLEKAESDRIRFVMSLGAILVVMAFCIMYIIRNNRIAKQLKRTNINLHRTHHSLSIATAEAMEADRNKTEFMQNMSHEIRTPLNAIVGFTQVLVGDDTPLSTEERLNMTKIVSSNTEVLNNLVNEILDLTSIETDKYVFKKDNVSINSICHRALSAASHLKPKDVSLLFEEQLPNSFCLATDADRVSQVLYNLLTNALKNTTQGSVVLDCTADGNSKKLTLSVTDTGIGVPKDKQKYIFERFSKLDTFKQGVGLGLDICRIIAQKLGGTIDIDPTYTNGARFVFTLPLVSCS